MFVFCVYKNFKAVSRVKTLLIALLLGAILVMANTSVFAVEFFRKQTGTASIAAGSTSVTVTIPAVCITQSFLVFLQVQMTLILEISSLAEE
jgi:hypothetical protein